MSTRKPKPSELPAFDLPAKQLQLITVSTQPKKGSAYPRAYDSARIDLQDCAPRSAKNRLH
jgi:hypothetical protein